MVLVLSERPRDKPVLVLGGHNEIPDQTPYRLAAARTVSKVVTLAEGKNTAEEARQAVRQVGEQLILCTSAYHQLRAFLTFLQALQQSGRERQVKIWNLAVWTQKVPIEDEFAKIAQYQAKGDCAEYADGLSYLQWRGP